MNKQHNKKRNTGLIYEFLVRYMARSIIEGNTSSFKKTKRILKKHFKQDTQLYREFRLFNSLVTTTASSREVAKSIVSEARRAAIDYEMDQLSREKSLLIKNINYGLKDKSVYEASVPYYTIYATVQTLLNDWRLNRLENIHRTAEYENKVVDWLVKQKPQQYEPEQSHSDSTNLVLEIARNKLNKKYNGTLNDRQKDLIRTYVFDDTSDSIKSRVDEILQSTVSAMQSLNMEFINENHMLEKIIRVETLVEKPGQKVTDDLVVRCLKYCELIEAVEDKNDNRG
jgi:hypothetical protein